MTTNKGHSVFTHHELHDERHTELRITEEEFQFWKKEINMFDALKGIRFGQSFCNHFGITNNLLYYTMGPEAAEHYIRKTYIA